ncbi:MULTISPECIES: type II toxin-antitoxin system PemK/MazF family toxin [Paenibacillus]|uniref:mRNA interferase MazF n=1 Tax=Paenibacillus silagei TaxID=1670801 RepID=A0ABS4NYD0_9BACL|nr:type II toxin-antitoxin system PemK/MazF family toxin [Paenibacillus silagei]MBP2115068.1 mRNA interferase MazF [Paenibacillus silagei]
MTNGQAKSDLDHTLENLKNVVQSLNSKQQTLITEWLKLYSDYLIKEQTFNPVTDTIKYEAGSIVSIELGYNPGSEHGGSHYAVVVEDNAKTSPIVVVVPLGSSKPTKAVHFNDVDLGVIPGINALSRYPADTKSIATVSQIRAISKIRISAPVRSGDQIIFVPTPELRRLYDKIKQRFTTKGLNRTNR